MGEVTDAQLAASLRRLGAAVEKAVEVEERVLAAVSGVLRYTKGEVVDA